MIAVASGSAWSAGFALMSKALKAWVCRKQVVLRAADATTCLLTLQV
jgi:hypothetical protein